jgi:hypothetical protein
MQVTNGSSQGTRPRRSLGCAFILLPISAVVLLALGVWYTYTSYNFSTNGVEVEGRVVRLDASTSDGSTTYSSVFEYSYEGQTYEYNSGISTNPPSNSVGDVETLLVNPENPSKARQNSFWDLWLIPVIMCPISFMMVVLSIAIPFFVRRMQ